VRSMRSPTSYALQLADMHVKPLDTLLAIKVLGLGLLPGLKANDQRVGIVLLEHFNRQNGRCDPGLDRVAHLLGISERTVMRANSRLERAGLFRKVRHGGLGNRNSYTPIWSAFQANEAAWRARMQKKTKFDVTNMSPDTRQTGHVRPDNAVTQTCSNNLHHETYSTGLPRKQGGAPGLHRLPKELGKRSLDAARDEAERRWNRELDARFRSKPITYFEIVEAMTSEIQSSATDAELGRHGAGIDYIIKRLRLE
jgi:hypothetical protein